MRYCATNRRARRKSSSRRNQSNDCSHEVPRYLLGRANHHGPLVTGGRMARITQSYAHGVSSTPLIGDTIGVYFDKSAERWPDRPALIVRQQNVRWTYSALQERVDAFAAGLLALGLAPGDRIGIWSPNNAEWVIIQFATAKAGLVMVNINPAYRIYELEYALNKVGCKALITAERFKASDYLGMLRELMPEIEGAAPGHVRAQRVPA